MSLKELNAKYPVILSKTKQVFFHKISGFTAGQLSPIIIYGFTSLTVIALYGNYMLVINGLIGLTSALTHSLIPAIGNVVAEGNIKKTLSVFNELFSIRFLITSVVCFCVFSLTPAFIELWLGKEFLLPTSTLILITAILYVSVSRFVVDSFLSAHGFFSDIWASIIELILNIGLSIVLGFFGGLNGVLLGALISLVIIVLGWKPIFLFYIKLKIGLKSYVILYIKHLLITAVVVGISYMVLRQFPIQPSKNIMCFLIYTVICVIGFTSFLSISYYYTMPYIRITIKRFLTTVNSFKI